MPGGHPDRFAIIGRQPDNKHYIRIQDQNGMTVSQNWAAIGSGIYAGLPAVAFVLQSSPAAPQNTLVVIGLGLDGRLYESRMSAYEAADPVIELTERRAARAT